MKETYLFDFDGTLTRKDTLLALLAWHGGKGRLVWQLLRRLHWLVLMKLGLYSNHTVKQRLFGSYFAGMPLEDFDALCRAFAESHRDALRPQGIATVRQALTRGADVAVVSASIDNWVRPFFEPLCTACETHEGQFRVLGTRVEVEAGRLTGRFATPNCYGQEKARRIRAAFPDIGSRRVVAFGDSRGDREMLRLAQESHYKPFR